MGQLFVRVGWLHPKMNSFFSRWRTGYCVTSHSSGAMRRTWCPRLGLALEIAQIRALGGKSAEVTPNKGFRFRFNGALVYGVRYWYDRNGQQFTTDLACAG